MEQLTTLSNLVYDELGPGYNETVYQEALCVLLRKENVHYSKEVVKPILFQGSAVGFVRFDIVTALFVIECKATCKLTKKDIIQINNYSKHTGLQGVLVNFSQDPSTGLEIKVN